jgi:hypothetical protein
MYSTILSKGKGAFLLGRMVQEHLPPCPLQDLPNPPLNHMAPSYWTASCSIPPLHHSHHETFQPFLTNQCTLSLKCGKIPNGTFTEKLPHLLVLQQLASTCLLFISGLINNTFILCTNIMACLHNISFHKIGTDHFG